MGLERNLGRGSQPATTGTEPCTARDSSHLTPPVLPDPMGHSDPKRGLAGDKRGGWQGAGGFWELPLLLPLLPVA